MQYNNNLKNENLNLYCPKSQLHCEQSAYNSLCQLHLFRKQIFNLILAFTLSIDPYRKKKSYEFTLWI